MVFAEFGNGSAFLEILIDGQSTLVATYKMNKLNDEEEEEKKEAKSDSTKDKELVKVYKSTKTDAVFIIPHKELGGTSSKAVMRKILSWVKPSNILLLDSKFKTAYASFEYISDANIIKYMKSSSVSADLSKTGAEPVDVTNGIGGFNAALLMYSEIHRIPCVLFLSILDSYEFTSETFGSYSGVLDYSSALKSHTADIGSLTKRGNYKEVLKRYNRRKNNIFN